MVAAASSSIERASPYSALAVCQLLHAEPIYDSLIGRIRRDRPDVADQME